jgi:hypothetical protein
LPQLSSDPLGGFFHTIKGYQMNTLKKTLFIIAVVFVTGYTIRHIYYKWFAPNQSVLDKYADSSTDAIKNATSLDQLVKIYDDAHKKVQAYESDKSNPKIKGLDRDIVEPYKTESKSRNAIKEWENRSKEIFEIRFYWSVGLLLVITGFLLYKKLNEWLGITLIIAGFAEKVYWTSPSFLSSTSVEYENLLTNKIIFSIGTLIFLVVVAFLSDTLTSKKEKTA